MINRPNKSRIHLVLEYMHCGSVQGVLEAAAGRRLGQAQARKYFGQLVMSLQHCHSRGVVHKDVKPANLMLDRAGDVRLSDFGCAEELGRYDSSDACVRTLGSPAFQSPEIAQGVERFSGIAADVWAAGVTLFQMVVGRTPFDADNLPELFEKIGAAQLELPQGLSPELRDLLSRLLCPDEKARISVEEIQRHPWMSCTLDDGSTPDDVQPTVHKPTIMDCDFEALDLYPAEVRSHAVQLSRCPNLARWFPKPGKAWLMAEGLLACRRMRICPSRRWPRVRPRGRPRRCRRRCSCRCRHRPSRSRSRRRRQPATT